MIDCHDCRHPDTVLATSDMLEIDGLHAFDFSLDAQKLLITAMDGRAEKRWGFSPE